MTLFIRIKERFPTRALEWFCSGLIFALGISMLAFPASFDRPGLSSFAQLMDPLVWSLGGIAVGGLRLCAMFINGHDPKVSLPARFVGTILGAGFYGLFVGRFVESSTSDAIAFGVITYAGLMVADIYNTMRVTADAKAEWGKDAGMVR